MFQPQRRRILVYNPDPMKKKILDMSQKRDIWGFQKWAEKVAKN